MTATLSQPYATSAPTVDVNRWRSITEPMEIRRSPIARHDLLLPTIKAHRVVSISVFPAQAGVIDGSRHTKLIKGTKSVDRARTLASVSSRDDSKSKIVGGAVLVAFVVAAAAMVLGSSVMAALAAVLLAFALLVN
ncbi:hypothetical protein [Aurantiacibacter aquimixticola]|uniref:hypothetical protein n=1 Tax=Aurantiacibacter aquimixticola TaxID=1958945 RepID=UPI001058EF64|nr:hypothetical protein [Aurantiacibacter aquimixticola]